VLASRFVDAGHGVHEPADFNKQKASQGGAMADDRQRGATSAEYSLLVFLIAATIFGAVALIGPELVPGFQTVVSGL
jgi:Flp pilus assembly pilin Flp